MPLKEEMIAQGNFLFKHRSYLPILILIVGLGVYINHIVNKGFDGLDQKYEEYIALFVSLLGLMIRIICVGYSHDNTSGRNTSEGQIADDVNQTGIYATVRHPLYLGNFLMWLGIALLTANLWFIIAFVFIYWVYYERIMIAEEEYLRAKFGSVYENWALVTPAFIPSLSKWTKPRLSFSLPKVIRQEKAGILNLFLVFFVFTNSPKIYLESYVPNIFWTYGLCGALAWYIVIKLLQKTTNVFAKDR